MNKWFMRGIIACLALIVISFVGTFGFASAAGAQAIQYDSVECMLNNYTDPSLQNHDGSYFEGTPLQFEAHLTDPDGHVKNIMFVAAQDRKGGTISEGTSTSAVWEHPLPGVWTVVAQLFDDSGREIIPNGDCDVNIVIVSRAASPQPSPSEPVPASEQAVPATPTPAEQTSAAQPAPPAEPAQSITTPGPATELAYTGASTTTTWALTVAGFMLITLGTMMVRSSRRKQA